MGLRMGLRLTCSVSDPGHKTVSPVTNGGNPNPYNFKILAWYETGNYTVVKVKYPDAKNFEGDKILLYKGFNLKALKQQTALDPHFFDKGVHPIARFIPTTDGWKMAASMADMLAKNDTEK